MTGGIIQLVAYGKEDLFLTRDPQITFFKIMYRRHTNFAREEIEQSFMHEIDFNKRSTCIISPDADLINKMTLKITLPAIPKFSLSTNDISSSTPVTTTSSTTTNAPTTVPTESINYISTNTTITRFAWIRKIGFAMIKYVEIEINNKVIDRHYGEWMHIFSSLTTNNIMDKGLEKLIGDVPELTDFTESKDEYILYVPLYFWFCRTSGLSLPVISLQLCDIKVNIEFYELEKCYIISPTHYIKCDANLVNFKPYEYLSQKGLDNIDRYGIFSNYDIINKRLYYTAITTDKFIGVPYDGNVSQLDINTKNAIMNTPRSDKYSIKGSTTNFTVKPDLGVKSITSHRKSLKNIHLKECVILVDFVYLDDDERHKFVRTKHDYLIEQLYFTPNVPIEGNNVKVKLDVDQPCKLTVWLAQLDYISDFNDRFNYTDSHIITQSNNSLIDESYIKLNSQARISNRLSDYFEYIQPYQHTINTLPDGCGMYSFALFPIETAPSGTTNMSEIDLVELNLKMNYKVNTIQRAKVRSYSLCYTVWRVDNGLSSPIFVR